MHDEVDLSSPEAAIAWLRSPEAVREQCQRIADAANQGRLEFFAIRPERLPATTNYVLEAILENYPNLNVPIHSRWRHFNLGGYDRWSALAKTLDANTDERARIRIELVTLSVLLDAGAGNKWQFRDPSGATYQRSEGLALASLSLYQNGLFADPKFKTACRIDASRLKGTSTEELTVGFQVNSNNPLIGLEGRRDLLRRLGRTLEKQPEVFGEIPRLGNLFDYIRVIATDGRISASKLLNVVLETLASIWPGDTQLRGVPLGDVWHHPQAGGQGLANGLVPFHKLSQWLTYSLLEPLAEAGIKVVDVAQLTGLPEYRNGGLFIDLGVIAPNNPELLSKPLTVNSLPVIEWRALTVVLLDRLAETLRAQLKFNEDEFPLAKLLEGGSWAAGRKIAKSRRPDGSPPIKLVSDGTVF